MTDCHACGKPGTHVVVTGGVWDEDELLGCRYLWACADHAHMPALQRIRWLRRQG